MLHSIKIILFKSIIVLVKTIYYLDRFNHEKRPRRSRTSSGGVRRVCGGVRGVRGGGGRRVGGWQRQKNRFIRAWSFIKVVVFWQLGSQRILFMVCMVSPFIIKEMDDVGELLKTWELENLFPVFYGKYYLSQFLFVLKILSVWRFPLMMLWE